MKKLVIVGIFLTPGIALATSTTSNLQGLIANIEGTVNLLIPAGLAIALLGFIYGVIKYIAGASNPAKIKEGKKSIVFSIIALAILLSIWSLATVVVDFAFPNNQSLNTSIANQNYNVITASNNP